MLGLQSNPQQRQRGGSTQTGRAESESESECSWQVRYLRLHKSGWQKHKFPHVASIREFPDSSTPHHQFLCITEPSTGRVQERVELGSDGGALQSAAFVAAADGQSIIRFALKGPPVKKFAIIADCGRSAAKLCRALHRRGVNVQGMDNLPDSLFLGGNDPRTVDALKANIPSLSRPEVQAYVMRLLFEDSFKLFVNDLREMFSHVLTYLPESSTTSAHGTTPSTAAGTAAIPQTNGVRMPYPEETQPPPLPPSLPPPDRSLGLIAPPAHTPTIPVTIGSSGGGGVVGESGDGDGGVLGEPDHSVTGASIRDGDPRENDGEHGSDDSKRSIHGPADDNTSHDPDGENRNATGKSHRGCSNGAPRDGCGNGNSRGGRGGATAGRKNGRGRGYAERGRGSGKGRGIGGRRARGAGTRGGAKRIAERGRAGVEIETQQASGKRKVAAVHGDGQGSGRGGRHGERAGDGRISATTLTASKKKKLHGGGEGDTVQMSAVHKRKKSSSCSVSSVGADGSGRVAASSTSLTAQPTAASENDAGTAVGSAQAMAVMSASAAQFTTSGRAVGLSKALKKQWTTVNNHRSAGAFRVGVNTDFAPDYLDVVKHPIDLSSIRARLDYDTHYKSKSMLYDDLVLMCNNAILYNASDTVYYSDAQDLLRFVESTMGSDL